MAIVTKQHTFSSGSTILSSEHNDNFDDIYADYNGNITNANIAAGAAIANSKINLASITQNISLSGNLTLTGSSNDFSGATFSDGGTVTTVDINGGTLDGVVIGGASSAKATVTSTHLPEGTAPTTAASEGALYTKDTSGQPELFFREESNGDEVQITSGGEIAGANTSASTTVFSWSSLNADNTADAISHTGNTNFTTKMNFRFKKIASINTITIEGRIWVTTASSGDDVTLRVTINGALTGSITRLSSSAGWATSSTIDVSSLSDGTVYNGIIEIQEDDATETAYCSAITLIGS